MLKIYGVPVSVHTRKVLIVAALKGLAHEIIPVVPVIPGNPPPNWRQLSPTGRIPAITDGDFTIADSTAICTYLDRAYPEHAIYPAAARELAQTLSLELYATEQLFRNVVRPLFHEVFVHPRIHNQPANQALIEGVFAESIPDVLGYLDGVADDEFLVGQTISAADFAIVSNLVTYHYCGFGLDRSRFPRLTKYFGRMINVPCIRETLQNEAATAATMGLNDDILKALAA
jgi:glutathione S-transferase